MHISLGVRTTKFPIEDFLQSGSSRTVELEAEPGPATLTFATNPNRRGGEWVIRDQFTHRHPGWSGDAGFPSTYQGSDPPYILIFRVSGRFHVRFSTARRLASAASALPATMLTDRKGIEPASRGLLNQFDIANKTTLEIFQDETHDVPSPTFDPENIEDGRQRIMREVYRRQGQQAFRRKLMQAYRRRCAITGERTTWVLEAAHITPYMGIKTNAVQNGLLLRADVHTLFDLALISVEPLTRKVRVSSELAGTRYAKLDGRRLAEPRSASHRPSTAALREHFSGFRDS